MDESNSGIQASSRRQAPSPSNNLYNTTAETDEQMAQRLGNQEAAEAALIQDGANNSEVYN